MTQKLKTIAALFVAVALPSIASAQYFMEDGLGYQVLSAAEHTVEVTGNETYTAYHGSIDIPSTVTHDGITYDVVALGKSAFYGATLSNVTIPSSVIEIKNECFRNANGPSTINIPASVTNIGFFALAANRLTTINVDEANPEFQTIDGMLFSKDTSTLIVCPSGKGGTITIPQNTKFIYDAAFFNCESITGVTLPNGMEEIGYWAFSGATHLNNIVIPASVTSIYDAPFGGCSALNNLSIDSSNTHYYMDAMAIYSIGGDTLVSCHKSADSLYLPSTLRVVGGFLLNKNIKYVHVPEGVTTIGSNAFEGSSLRSIDLPNHLEDIGSFAFCNCSYLSHVGMPTTLDTMGRGAFELCTRLTSVNIPNGLRTLPLESFMWCPALAQVTWGDSIETIDSYAFGNCAFRELEMPTTLRIVRYEAFWKGPKLNRVVFTAPVDTLEDEVFDEHPLGTLVLKNTIPPIVVSPFYDTIRGFLTGTTVDTIIIPCGSLNAYLADSYWSQFEDKYHEDCNGINNAMEELFSVYPNPATDRLTVNGTPDCLFVEIISIDGHTILTKKLSNIQTVSLDVSSLTRGAYFLRLHTPDGITTQKVILQ